jgi:glycerol-3-phosphate dehydrogenase (NAD(P)+)
MLEAGYRSAVVLGAGSWGTALASLLAERGVEVQLWGRDAALMKEMRVTRRNARYLPGLELAASIEMVPAMGDLSVAEVAFWVTPSRYLHEMAAAFAKTPCGERVEVAISCSKGIEIDSGRRMSELLKQELPRVQCAVLTGPNHAEEVASRMATAAVVGCDDLTVARRLQQTLTLPWFRSYTTDDVCGAEWGGALKNPYAIAAGIAKGLDLGDNAIAALVTRALAEMVRFGTAMGGRAETFYGLSGVGDLMTTCFSEHSRNHRVGVALGRGESLEAIQGRTTMVAEGVPNTASLFQVARQTGARTPILDEVYEVLYAGKAPAKAMRDLLGRDPRPEAD